MNATASILTYVLEDDSDVLDIIKEMLHENGITQYSLFTSPTDFLKDLNSDINICVIDHYLTGGLDGIQVIKEIKAKNEFSYVIIMSGQKNFDVAVAYLNNGAEKYVDKTKPKYLETLIQELQTGFKIADRRIRIVKALESQKEKHELATG